MAGCHSSDHWLLRSSHLVTVLVTWIKITWLVTWILLSNHLWWLIIKLLKVVNDNKYGSPIMTFWSFLVIVPSLVVQGVSTHGKITNKNDHRYMYIYIHIWVIVGSGSFRRSGDDGNFKISDFLSKHFVELSSNSSLVLRGIHIIIYGGIPGIPLTNGWFAVRCYTRYHTMDCAGMSCALSKWLSLYTGDKTRYAYDYTDRCKCNHM